MNLSKFDAADYIRTDEDAAAYLSAALEENDSQLLLAALGDIACARGIANIAESNRTQSGKPV